ncbi:MAG: hypothetical protein LIR50_07150 [Bacillota bacterium]|nr:hypothetical protein [Bacillota bacterium]
MEVMIISALAMVLIFLAFIIGLHYGSKVKHNEVIEMPTINPIKVVKKNIEQAKAEKQQEKEKIIEEINLSNIDSYDGTGIGQKDFPKE